MFGVTYAKFGLKTLHCVCDAQMGLEMQLTALTHRNLQSERFVSSSQMSCLSPFQVRSSCRILSISF